VSNAVIVFKDAGRKSSPM